MRVRVPQEMSTANRKKYNDFRDNVLQTDSKQQQWQSHHNFTFKQANAETIENSHDNSLSATIQPATNLSLFNFPDNVDN
jgi:hypothetical protein